MSRERSHQSKLLGLGCWFIELCSCCFEKAPWKRRQLMDLSGYTREPTNMSSALWPGVAGGRAVSRDTTGFHDFLHGLRCSYMNSGMSGWKGQTLLILKCRPMLRCSPHTDTHLTFSQKSVNKNNSRFTHIWQSGLIWSILVIGFIYWLEVRSYFRSLFSLF